MSKYQKLVAVVVPFYQTHLTAGEEISLKHLRHYLGAFDLFLVAPESLAITLKGFAVKRFPDRFFRNLDTYSALLLWKDFYESFDDYEHILIYQLDALVFSDGLLEWCDKDFDYIGAPWFISPQTTAANDFARVGNGGLSLRRVSSFLKVLNSPNYFLTPIDLWRAFMEGKPKYIKHINRWRKRAMVLPDLRRCLTDDTEFVGNEDGFWSFRAQNYYENFKVATPAEGFAFSFETEPRRCYEINNYQLPFGCHAWQRYDRAFWEPFLLSS